MGAETAWLQGPRDPALFTDCAASVQASSQTLSPSERDSAFPSLGCTSARDPVLHRGPPSLSQPGVMGGARKSANFPHGRGQQLEPPSHLSFCLEVWRLPGDQGARHWDEKAMSRGQQTQLGSGRPWSSAEPAHGHPPSDLMGKKRKSAGVLLSITQHTPFSFQSLPLHRAGLAGPLFPAPLSAPPQTTQVEPAAGAHLGDAADDVGVPSSIVLLISAEDLHFPAFQNVDLPPWGRGEGLRDGPTPGSPDFLFLTPLPGAGGSRSSAGGTDAET